MRLIWTLLLAALLASPAASPASAQGRPAPTLDLSAGWVGFADDGIVSETPFGAAARFYVTPRLSVGPEFTFIAADSHNHQILTGNVTFDFISPQPRRLIPFVVAGGGLYRTSESFAGSAYSSSEGAFTAGGGVRYMANRNVSMGVDARLGWEPHLRVTGVVTIHFPH